jgi:hypothetical protein
MTVIRVWWGGLGAERHPLPPMSNNPGAINLARRRAWWGGLGAERHPLPPMSNNRDAVKS